MPDQHTGQHTCVHIAWYATAFRADQMEIALRQISELSVRYGGRGYSVYRSHEDRYKFLQVLEFDHQADFERFWYGPDFTDMRASTQSWYQVPLLYTWYDVVAEGTVDPAVLEAGQGAR